MTAVDTDAESCEPAAVPVRPDHTPVTDLVAALPGLDDLDAVQGALVDALVRATAAPHVALLLRDATGGLRLVAESDSRLPARIPIGDVRSRLWGAVLGRATLEWDGAEDAPGAFADQPGWQCGFIVGLPSRTGQVTLIAVGGVVCDADTREVAEALAGAAGPVIDTLQLRGAAARTRTLLRRVTDLASRLAVSGSEAGLLSALVEELAGFPDIEGAAVYAPPTDDDALVPTVAAASGASAVAQDPSLRDRVLRILSPDTSPAVRHLLSNVWPLPDGRNLTLLPITSTPQRLLGLVHPDALEADARDVLVSLVGAVGPALVQARMAEERRTLLGTFSRVLRPGRAPEGLDIAVEYHPNTSAAEAFGGDFYDWFAPDPDRLLLALGDVAGKGIPAAAAASMAVWSLRALCRMGRGVEDLADGLDRTVADELHGERFVTLCLLELDRTTWGLRVLLAGHPAPIQLGGSGGPATTPTADRPLGVLPGSTPFTAHASHLGPGEGLMLFTDGISEATSPDGERLGRRRLREMAAAAWADHSSGAADVAAKVWEGVHGWAGGAPDDDCALIVLRRIH